MSVILGNGGILNNENGQTFGFYSFALVILISSALGHII
jgi:hypothetical protein